jgi:hypothetical protein
MRVRCEHLETVVAGNGGDGATFERITSGVFAASLHVPGAQD